MTNLYGESAKRFVKEPTKKLLQTSLFIQGKDLGIKYSKDNFEVADSFDFEFDFAYLSRSPLLGYISSSELDKSYNCHLQIMP